MPYVPLQVRSHFSFLRASSSPEELVQTAASLGYQSLGMADFHGISGLVRAHLACKEAGMRLIAGSEICIERKDLAANDIGSHKATFSSITLYPESARGYASLCRALTLAQSKGPKGVAFLTVDELKTFAIDLIGISSDASLLLHLRESFGRSRLFGFIGRHLTEYDRENEIRLRSALRLSGLQAIGGTEVLFHDRRRKPLHDVMTAIRHHTTVDQAASLLRPNAENSLLAEEEMFRRFGDDPKLLHRTSELAERCQFSFDDLRYVYPEERLPNGHNETSWLRTLALQGAARRYPLGVPDTVLSMLDHELNVIGDLSYGGYFLTMHEIVEFCRQKQIYCQGRGSAANSAVCFCLGITAVDPSQMTLLFERFLSRERAEPPDIDLDIEHERREEVIQHVYDRYGRRNAAMVANVIRYRGKSALREVGKALGIPLTDIDSITKIVSSYGEDLSLATAQEAGLRIEASSTRFLLTLAEQLVGTPRHLGIHPGGFLLGHKPIDELVPVEPATMPGRTIVQWDKYDIEALALFKVDLLGLGSLTCIRRCLQTLSNLGIRSLAEDRVYAESLEDGATPPTPIPPLDLADIPIEDASTYDMLCAGDTVGVFQVESRAQMAMLPRLRPRTFYDLVIQVAIVRPGPIQGDMVHPYLRRRSGQEPVYYPHERLEQVLSRTLGVPIFQEQVMRIAVEVADYSPGEADQLRRDMAAWKVSGRIERHHERMISAMVRNGIAIEFAERVFAQIRGFGEYGFPESHAASFALLSYMTAWLRRHHPAVFLCAMLNSQPMGFYTEATLVEDAKRHGVDVSPIDIHHSDWDSKMELCPTSQRWRVRMGFRLVKGMTGAKIKDVISERHHRSFASLSDVVTRTKLNERDLLTLAESGAFASFGTRRDILWQVRAAMQHRDAPLLRLLEDESSSETAKSDLFLPLRKEEAVVWDYRKSDHSTHGHPMQALRSKLQAQGFPASNTLLKRPHRSNIDFVGMVICRQRPLTASGVTFLTLEDEFGFANIVVWKQVASRHRILLKTATFLGISGKIEHAQDTTHLIADKLWEPIDFVPPARRLRLRSRDFF